MENQIISLKKFDEGDWSAYAGCDTDNPMISDISVTMDDKSVGPWYEKFDGCLVLDGNSIFMDVGNDNKAPDDNRLMFTKTFHNEHYALTWLKRLDKSYDCSVDGSLLYSWLIEYHGFTLEP